jgi:hypothetical protein
MKRERQVTGVVAATSRSQEHHDFSTESASAMQQTPSLTRLMKTFALAQTFLSTIQAVKREAVARSSRGARGLKNPAGVGPSAGRWVARSSRGARGLKTFRPGEKMMGKLGRAHLTGRAWIEASGPQELFK